MRMLPLRLAFWIVLLTGERRTNQSGTAVCCLSGASRRPKAKGSLVALVGLLVLAGLWAASAVTWPIFAAAIIGSSWYWPMIRNGFAGLGARRALQRARPSGRAVVVHTVASIEPGAGRHLLTTLVAEADDKGWLLVLDAANERLAHYYGQFGFATTGPPVPMPWGEENIPMARQPNPEMCNHSE